MFLEVEGSCEEGYFVGVSGFIPFPVLIWLIHLLFSTPTALVYEKFNVPDGLRIVDGIVETLLY